MPTPRKSRKIEYWVKEKIFATYATSVFKAELDVAHKALSKFIQGLIDRPAVPPAVRSFLATPAGQALFEKVAETIPEKGAYKPHLKVVVERATGFDHYTTLVTVLKNERSTVPLRVLVPAKLAGEYDSLVGNESRIQAKREALYQELRRQGGELNTTKALLDAWPEMEAALNQHMPEPVVVVETPISQIVDRFKLALPAPSNVASEVVDV